ncbi:hypothetical protein B0J11DRAFT_589379 [Dendryphion nanum]|uniref:Zn(2)-C6 fungal-type domain-containing protein n=1 Tax=Dendryphion nanum TaxID=256645 RepID=A0A9P9IXN8_9PLEO|nr:hypothetical protein B0J11DRAFT_589379 [Dendryphion nanum]
MSSSGIVKRGSGATVRACDSCRRRKRKCVWSPGAESCAPCIASKDDCSTTHIRKPRAKSIKRTNRVAEYESRIQRLESLLSERTTAQPAVFSQPLQVTDIQASLPLNDWVSNLNNEISSWPLEEGPRLGPLAFDAGFEGFFDDIDASELQIDSTFDESSFAYTASPEDSILIQTSHNSSESFTDITSTYSPSIHLLATVPQLPPPETPQPLPSPSTISNPQDPLQTRTPITYIQPALPRRAKCDGYLPTPSLGTSLLKEFLLDFNTAIPLFQPYALASHLHICYTGASDGTVVSWSSAYIVFGIAHRLRAMSAGGSRQDNEQADYYMRRVIQNVPELLMEKPSLGAVQCLLGLAHLIQTSDQAGLAPHATFVSTALRMAMELSQTSSSSSPNPQSPLHSESEQSQYTTNLNRTFWLSFILDTETRLLSPHPLSLHTSLTPSTPSLPSPNPPDAAGAITAAESPWQTNIFALRADLALIQSKAIETIFPSHKPENSSEREATRKDLLQKLENWRQNSLFTFPPEKLSQLLYRSDMVHIVNLEASYFTTVLRIHIPGTNTTPFSPEGLRQLSRAPGEKRCITAAKRLLDLLLSAAVPLGDYGWCWANKYSIIAALIIIFSHSSPSPSQTDTTTNPANYATVLDMLHTLAQKSEDEDFRLSVHICSDLFDKAGNSHGFNGEDGLRIRHVSF